MDVYEQKYNFRHEEKNSTYLTTHTRVAPEDSMRRVEDKRKQARLDAKTRKEEEKLRRKEEINKLKAIKREEILEKIKKTEFVAGKKLLEKAEKELGTEFIPDMYDKHMEQMFNE